MNMNVIEIVCGVLLLVACLVLIVLVMMQEGKQGMSQSLGGGSSDSYLDKNSGRTLDAVLAKITKVAAIAFFVLTVVVTVVAVYHK